MPFRFRAAAALDMRRKQEDAARLALAVAENAVMAATRKARDAADRVSDEGRKLVDAQREGTEVWRVQWHRAWIERQREDAAARAREVSERSREAAAAAAVAREAMKKRRVLERLRDRSWEKFQKDEHDQHVRDMNELATLRFVAQIAEEGGTSAS
jgi:flagellar biosynthesis chaperone FliJ